MKKHYIRIASLILAGAIIFSLTSCKGNKNPDDAAPETEKQDISAQITEKFTAAADKLNSLSSVDLDVTVDTVRKVGTDEYSEFSEKHFDYSDINKETLTVLVTDKTVLDETVITTEEIYSAGKAFCTYDTGEIFLSEMTEEDFLARHIPPVIIDPSIYSSVYYSEKDKNTIHFEDAEKLESWIAPEYAVLTDACASATVDDSGFIESMEYFCTYTRGNATFTTTCKVMPTVDENSPPELPKEKDCISTDNIDVLKYVLYSSDRISSTAAVSASETKEIVATVSESVLMAMSVNESYSLYEKEDLLAARAGGSISTQDINGSTSYQWTETFKDGRSYASENGSEEKENSAKFADYRSSIKNTILGYLPSSHNFSNLTLSETDEFLLIEYTLDNSCADGEVYNEYVCEMLYSDPNYLKSNTESYTTQKIGGYIAIDKDAMIPTALAVEFSGYYTLADNTLTVALAQNISVDIATDRAYTDVTDTFPPEEEPKSKAKPLFYTVTGPDGEKMYLLGTIHIGDERTAYLPDEIYSSLDSSDVLAVEINTDTFENRIIADSALMELLYRSYYYLDGTTLKDHVSEELYTAAVKALKISGAYSPYSEITRPSVLCQSLDYFLTDSSKTLSSHKGIEQRIMRYAKANGIEIADIETVTDRLNMDIRYSEATQKMILAETLSTSRIEAISRTNELFDLWCEGDEKKLTEYIRGEDETIEELTEEEKTSIEEYNKIMVTERDEKMIKKAKEYLNGDKTVFFAVGLAHLLGETGLVDALREAGYTVELVEYK